MRARLQFAMLFVLLPALGYIVVTSALARSRARDQAEAEMLASTRLVASAEQQAEVEMGRTLALAATLPSVRVAAQGGDPAACQDSLSQIAGHYPQSLGFNVWSGTGDAICADPPLATPSNAADKLWFRQALATRTLALGEFELGGAAGQSSLTFGYPVISAAGEPIAVLSAGLNLNLIIAPDSNIPLPADARVVIFDHAGIVLARSQEAAAGLGQPEAPGLAASLGQGSGVSEQVGSDGVRRLYAFTPVPGPGGSLVYLSIARPLIAVFGPADTALVTSLLIAAGLAILSLALAGLWARQALLRPMNSLLTATDRLAHGDLSTRAQRDPAGGELDRLAVDVNQVAVRLEKREADLEQAQAGRQEAERRARAAAEQVSQQTQHAQARAAQLDAVIAGLSQALTPASVIDVILHQGAGAVGAAAATLLLLSPDGAWLRRAAVVGYSDRIGRLFQQYPVSSPLPPADVVRTGEAVWLELSAVYRARYPQLTEVIDSADYEAAAALPLRFAGRIIGVLALSFPNIVNFSSDIQSHLLILAGVCAQALERVRLYEATQGLRIDSAGALASPGASADAPKQ